MFFLIWKSLIILNLVLILIFSYVYENFSFHFFSSVNWKAFLMFIPTSQAFRYT